MGADDGIAFVAEFVEVPVVYPDVLRELELADEARADDEGGDPALDSVVGSAFQQRRPIRRPSPDHPAPVHVVPRVARIYPANVRAKRDRIAVRVHLLVVEVVVALHVGAQRRIVFFRREHERRSAAPAPHQLGRDQFLLLGSVAVLPEKLAKFPHMLLEPPVGHVAAVPRENFGLWTVGYDAVFVGIAQDELAWLQRLAGSGRRFDAISFDGRLRQPVAIAEMFMRVSERRNGLKVEHGEDLDAVAAGDKLPVLRDAPVVLRRVPRKENDDRMQIGARKAADPMFGGVHAGVAEHLRARRHALLELLRKRRERSLVQSERAEAVPGESRRHPALVLVDARTHRGRRMNRLFDRRRPGAAPGSVAKRQKFVSGGERRGAGQQQVLDVVKFEHRDVPCLADLAVGDRQLRVLQMSDLQSPFPGIIASGRAWSRTRPSV